MPFIGNKPSAVPLTSADIADGIITSAKIVDATIANADIANSTIALAKLSATGTADATTFLRGDNSWASAGAAAGQVIQVVTATDNTTRTVTSTSFVTASNTLSVTITPSSASNKILIMYSTGMNAEGYMAYTTVKRNGSTNLGDTQGFTINNPFPSGYVDQFRHSVSAHYLDSPNTTSATTYQVYISTDAGAISLNYGDTRGSITALEIKG